MSEPIPSRQLRRWLRSDTRLVVSLLVALGVGVGVAQGSRWSFPVHAIAVLNAFAFTYLSFAWSFIGLFGGHSTRAMAAEQDSSRAVVFVIVLLSTIVSFFAAAFVLRALPLYSPEHQGLLRGLCMAAIVETWLLTHTLFTLHYAHLYHGETPKGLGFPGEGPVNDWDFAYFAFTVGMCFQTSDVAVTTSRMRRAVAGHAVVSYAFTTVIIAMTINLLAQV